MVQRRSLWIEEHAHRLSNVILAMTGPDGLTLVHHLLGKTVTSFFDRHPWCRRASPSHRMAWSQCSHSYSSTPDTAPAIVSVLLRHGRDFEIIGPDDRGLSLRRHNCSLELRVFRKLPNVEHSLREHRSESCYHKTARIELRQIGEAVGRRCCLATVERGNPEASFTVLRPFWLWQNHHLRLIAGLDSASRGEILIDGRNVTLAPPSQRGVAMVFQNYALFPRLSVAANIVFGLQVRRVSARTRPIAWRASFHCSALKNCATASPLNFSGGQQQRVALARPGGRYGHHRDGRAAIQSGRTATPGGCRQELRATAEARTDSGLRHT